MSKPSDIQSMNLPLGQLTGVALQDTDCLFLPFAADAFGHKRRPLGLQGMKLSLELARMAYTMDIGPWMRAGWTDVSIQVDNQLTTGLNAKEVDSFADRVQAGIGSFRLTRARMALKEHNPLSRVTGALRQREESDTIKAVVMVHPAADGRFVVAIGFMGTGGRFYDWFSNFRVSMSDGFHKGFYQLTQAFLRKETDILFPDTAKALGLSSLTLTDILNEMQKETSRFFLWLAGHSQGAAVMQVYCNHLLRKRNTPHVHVLGCGFASPTVAANNFSLDGSDYPLYHILNADDLVTRMGSMNHFGLCLQYTPDARFRDMAYGWSQTTADRKARRDVERLMLHITDTPSFLMAFTALLEVICEEKTDDTIFGVSEGFLSIAPIDRMFSFAGRKAKGTLKSMIIYMRKTYQENCGMAMDEAAVNFLKESCRPIVKATPLKQLMSALYDRLYPPHRLYNNSENGAYWRIVIEHSGQLKPFIWENHPAAPPHKRYARRYYVFPGQPPLRFAVLTRRRTRTSPRRRAIHVRR